MAKMTAKRNRFPGMIFVYVDPNAGDDTTEDLNAYREEVNAVEDNGPTIIATYKFMGTRQLSKKVVVADG
ncbi:MAG: hypothetical protein ACLP1Y_09060 [Candidatus Acidiferrales bacterium]